MLIQTPLLAATSPESPSLGLYPGLSWFWQVYFYAVLGLILIGIINHIVLSVAALRMRHRGLPPAAPEDFLWVFFVPALDEEVTIADSVSRLAATDAPHKLIMVIDDGSEDATANILATLDVPDLQVLSRKAPDARIGKAAALNAAWRHLHGLLATPRYSRWRPEQVIVVVVDADGRLSANAPAEFSRHFANPQMGGVQSLVRIYNRRSWLTWAQDLEFSAFGRLFQQGRAWWGTANMGGNGQANRLAALDDVATENGPWRNKLTEDQDIGVRLLHKGWLGSQDLVATVDQQGVNSLRRLWRQRTRWAQGGWEATALAGTAHRIQAPWWARIDALIYLFAPLVQLVILASFLSAIILAVTLELPLWARTWPLILFFVSLSFLPGFIGLVARGETLVEKLFAVILVIPYTLYAWIILPVVVRALFRLVFGRTSWTKTAREPLNQQTEEESPARGAN